MTYLFMLSAKLSAKCHVMVLTAKCHASGSRMPEPEEGGRRQKGVQHTLAGAAECAAPGRPGPFL